MTYNDREFLSSVEITEKLKANKRSIQRVLADGVKNSTIAFVQQGKFKYYDYNQFYDIYSHKQRHNYTRKKKKQEFTIPNTEAPTVKLPSVSIPSLEDREESNENVINLSNIDPNDFKDCWKINPLTMELMTNPVTEQPQMDYDLLKSRLTSEKYNLDLNVKRGLYVEKETCKRYLMGMAKIISTSLEAIPRRYSAQIIAECADITGHAFTAEESTRIRNVIKNEAPQVMTSIQTEISKIIDEGER